MIPLTVWTLFSLSTFLIAEQGESWEQTRDVAGTQHEIIMLLIDEKKFGEIPEAAEKIFDLDFPENHQNLYVQEAQLLTDALILHEEFKVAHQVLDVAVKCAKTDKIKARIFREKAFLYKKEGNSEEAMRYFEESLALERGTRPSKD
jgi:tetratricopeptide (TPR) repeat protein